MSRADSSEDPHEHHRLGSDLTGVRRKIMNLGYLLCSRAAIRDIFIV